MADLNLAWMDLEMTGLNPQEHHVIEIATIVTDADLNILATGPVLAIHQSDAVLKRMGKWCTKQHQASGLTQRVQESTITEREAEDQTLTFLRKHLNQGETPLCGNSIWQDRRFLCRYMPTLESFFHYRNIDVSSLKELARRWQPDLLGRFQKTASHLALDDIKDSIEELKYYRNQGFIKGNIEN